MKHFFPHDVFPRDVFPHNVFPHNVFPNSIFPLENILLHFSFQGRVRDFSVLCNCSIPCPKGAHATPVWRTDATKPSLRPFLPLFYPFDWIRSCGGERSFCLFDQPILLLFQADLRVVRGRPYRPVPLTSYLSQFRACYKTFSNYHFPLIFGSSILPDLSLTLVLSDVWPGSWLWCMRASNGNRSTSSWCISITYNIPRMMRMPTIQGGAAYHSQGFEDKN